MDPLAYRFTTGKTALKVLWDGLVERNEFRFADGEPFDEFSFETDSTGISMNMDLLAEAGRGAMLACDRLMHEMLRMSYHHGERAASGVGSNARSFFFADASGAPLTPRSILTRLGDEKWLVLETPPDWLADASKGGVPESLELMSNPLMPSHPYRWLHQKLRALELMTILAVHHAAQNDMSAKWTDGSYGDFRREIVVRETREWNGSSYSHAGSEIRRTSYAASLGVEQWNSDGNAVPIRYVYRSRPEGDPYYAGNTYYHMDVPLVEASAFVPPYPPSAGTLYQQDGRYFLSNWSTAPGGEASCGPNNSASVPSVFSPAPPNDDELWSNNQRLTTYIHYLDGWSVQFDAATLFTFK